MTLEKNSKLKLKFATFLDVNTHIAQNINDASNRVKKYIAELQGKTQTINNKKSPEKIRTFLLQLKTLQLKYPISFPKSTRPALKKGITLDIAKELGISNRAAKKFMAWYTLSPLYLQLHKVGMPRYDLNGNIIEHITQKEEHDKKALLGNVWKKGYAHTCALVNNEQSHSKA